LSHVLLVVAYSNYPKVDYLSTGVMNTVKQIDKETNEAHNIIISSFYKSLEDENNNK
jgi:hypothetical protein